MNRVSDPFYEELKHEANLPRGESLAQEENLYPAM